MRAENSDGVFTIFLDSEIDAQNATEIKGQIDGLLPSRGGDPSRFRC